MSISIASTNARLDRARTTKIRAASEALAHVEEDEEEQVPVCEVCETVIDIKIAVDPWRGIGQNVTKA